MHRRVCDGPTLRGGFFEIREDVVCALIVHPAALALLRAFDYVAKHALTKVIHEL